jgi:hypothetical protein
MKVLPCRGDRVYVTHPTITQGAVLMVLLLGCTESTTIPEQRCATDAAVVPLADVVAPDDVMLPRFSFFRDEPTRPAGALWMHAGLRRRPSLR